MLSAQAHEIQVDLERKTGLDIRSLFDPVQTHAAYQICEERVPAIRASLKSLGATRFRIVKTRIKGLVVVCFKMKVAKS